MILVISKIKSVNTDKLNILFLKNLGTELENKPKMRK